jgi:hypothetical protein
MAFTAAAPDATGIHELNSSRAASSAPDIFLIIKLLN